MFQARRLIATFFFRAIIHSISVFSAVPKRGGTGWRFMSIVSMSWHVQSRRARFINGPNPQKVPVINSRRLISRQPIAVGAGCLDLTWSFLHRERQLLAQAVRPLPPKACDAPCPQPAKADMQHGARGLSL